MRFRTDWSGVCGDGKSPDDCDASEDRDDDDEVDQLPLARCDAVAGNAVYANERDFNC